MIPTIVIALLVAGFGFAMAYSRTLKHDVATWHVDPLTAPKPSTPNSYRVGPANTTDADAEAPVFDASAGTVGAAFDAMVNDENFVELVGGSAEAGWVTYVQRSTLFGFPDYISVRFIDLDGDRSTLAMFSRSRLGQSDLGVNKKRVTSWLENLTARVN